MEKIDRIKEKINEIIEKISIDELVQRIKEVDTEDYDIVFSEEILLEEHSIYTMNNESIMEDEYTKFSIHKNKTNSIFNIFSKNKKENIDLREAA